MFGFYIIEHWFLGEIPQMMPPKKIGYALVVEWAKISFGINDAGWILFVFLYRPDIGRSQG